MNRRVKVGLALALILCLAAVGAAVAAGSGAQIGWSVMASGGGAASDGAGVEIMDTIGQPVVGEAALGGTSIGSGFWYRLAVNYGIFLPIITR